MRKPIVSIFALAVIFFSIAALAADRRKDKKNLVIMTWNVEFMWDGRGDEEGQVMSKTPQQADNHMKALAVEIIKHDPDIINLVEVENKQALDRLNGKYLKEQGYNAFLKDGDDTYTEQEVAILTRITPMERIARYSIKGQSYDAVDNSVTRKSVSKNHYTLFKLGDLKLAVIGLHFLSNPSDIKKIEARQAQADAMADLARILIGDGFEVIMLGDFNDYDGVVKDLGNNLPKTNVLEICKLKTDGDPSNDLINVASRIESKYRYTAHYDKNRNRKIDSTKELSSIDHILISKGLTGRLAKVSIPHEHDVINVSDHYPLLITLTTAD